MAGLLAKGSHATDSLLQELNHCSHDTTRILLLKDIGKSYFKQGDFTTSIFYYQQTVQLADSMIQQKFFSQMAREIRVDAYRYLALNIENTDSFALAPEYFTKAFQLAGQENLWSKQCQILGHIGMYYYNVGDYPQSLDYSLRQLEMAKKLDEKARIASAYNRIGINYKRQMMHDQALEYLFKSADLFLELGDSGAASNSWNNAGNVYFNMRKFDLAYSYYQKQLYLGQWSNDSTSIADAFNCIAQIYNEVAFFPVDSLIRYFEYDPEQIRQIKPGFLLDSAEYYFLKSAAFYRSDNEFYELADCYNGLGKTYMLQGKYTQAIQAFQTEYALAKSIGVLQKEMSASLGLYKNFKNLNDYKEALQWYEIYNLIQDSVFNESKLLDIGRLESRHEFEVKEAEMIANQNQERLLVEADQKRQRTITMIIGISLGLVFILLLFLFNRFQLIKKQKHTIEEHKIEIEAKQKEIVDSINYAKRLQHAILANEDEIRCFFPKSFLLYKPKDIVAGDFYFFEKTDTHVFYAAADCTGHGVPGAMVSIVCSNALSRSIKEFGLTAPGEILDQTCKLVVATFEKSGTDVRDGMDISLLAKNIHTNEVRWSGANNSLWIVSENASIQIKADKQHIGKSEKTKAFTTHTLSLEKNSMLYLFTDGYADQFGGENLPGGKEGGKKFKTSRLIELLRNSAHQGEDVQKNILDVTFENWRGDLEQLDDVCVLGIRV
jgi:tetratricopeptide (TPR) repeat protein